MTRIWTIGVLSLVLLAASLVGTTTSSQGQKPDAKGDKELKVEGKLTDDGTKDKKTQLASNVHKFTMIKDTTYAIKMHSEEVDSYLRLEDKDGNQVAQNHDSDGNATARIVFRCEADGEYKVICTCFPQPMAPLKTTGSYTLTVRVANGDEAKETPKGPSFQEIYGKAAPDLVGDFCLNGDIKKLSNLKGKVVFIDFWAVWCGPCIANFPRLRDWAKQYKKDGLEILGVTTYFEQYAFDTQAGKLKRLEKDKSPLKVDEENRMLAQFAKHYELSHPLLAVSKDAWEKAKKDYAFQGSIPTAVLVDRKGNVRLVRIGSGEANAKELESGIKKLLAEPGQ
jgi:thiol-disulfide isomerase/thioredoxin